MDGGAEVVGDVVKSEVEELGVYDVRACRGGGIKLARQRLAGDELDLHKLIVAGIGAGVNALGKEVHGLARNY